MKSWGVYAAAVLGFVIYGAVTKADRDDSGAIINGGNIGAFEIRVGDCFNDANDNSDEIDDEIADVPGTPCDDPHDNEAYAIFDLSGSSYPGADEIAGMAVETCIEKFESFVGRDYESSTLDVFTLHPSPDSWLQNDREVICAVYDMNANKLVGSAKGKSL